MYLLETKKEIHALFELLLGRLRGKLAYSVYAFSPDSLNAILPLTLFLES